MAKPYRLLRDRMGPDRRLQNEVGAHKILAALPLQKLRQARDFSQRVLAKELDMTQPEISKLEHRADMYVSTLRRYIEAMGGTLEIRATFPDGTILKLGRLGDGIDEPSGSR